MKRLQDRVVIVTGAARGQGAAEAERLVAEGAFVLLADVLDAEGQKLAASLGSQVAYHHLDVRSEAEWKQTVDFALQRFGRVDVLVNNAAVLRIAPIMDLTPEMFHFVTEVNYVGPYLGMRAVIPAMLRQGSGSIINISSINGLAGGPGFAAYAGSKHGLLGMTKSVAMELGASGIRVNAVCPGGIDTPMIDEASTATGIDAAAALARKIPMGRVAKAEEMAGIIVFLCSDDSSYCTGGVFTVDGGLTAGFSLA